jgi:hypothetical protein
MDFSDATLQTSYPTFVLDDSEHQFFGNPSEDLGLSSLHSAIPGPNYETAFAPEYWADPIDPSFFPQVDLSPNLSNDFSTIQERQVLTQFADMSSGVGQHAGEWSLSNDEEESSSKKR